MSNIMIVGGGSSLGKTLRGGFLKAGHSVYSVGRSGPDANVNFFDYREAGDAAEVLAMQLIKSAVTVFHGKCVDSLIFNAGVTNIDFMPAHSMEDFEKVLFFNLTMGFVFAKYFVKHVADSLGRKAPRRLIFTTSSGVDIGMVASAGYVASKAGLEGLCRVTAKECAIAFGDKFAALCVAPGAIEGSGMIEEVIAMVARSRGVDLEEASRLVTSGSALGRMMTMEELFPVYDFAVHNSPAHMSGTTLNCPGGSGRR